MNPNELSSPAQLMKYIVGKWISKPIYAAAELCIADILADGPKSIEELAHASQTHAPTLYRMMRALASVGIFSETEDKQFELTPMAEYLKTGAMRSIALMFNSDWNDRAWGYFLDSVKTESKLLVVEMVIPPGNEPSIAKLLDLEMLVITGGRERTEAEFKNLFESSGFKISRIIPTKENVCIIEGIRE